MPLTQGPVGGASDESRVAAKTGSTQPLAAVLDRLATQLDDSTHGGIGLAVRLMIEHRDKEAKLRQSDGYPRIKEMKRLRLPLKGHGAEDAFLRFIHAAATSGTSSGWQAKLERDLFADIETLQHLCERGEGQYLERVSGGRLTIAILVSRLAHLRTRLRFWAASLESYPPPLVHDIVGLVAEAAKQLRDAANLPACDSPSLEPGTGPSPRLESDDLIEVPLTKDQLLVLAYLAEKSGMIAAVVDITRGTSVKGKQTVTNILRFLESQGLSARAPRGKGRGRVITAAGLDRARRSPLASQIRR
ncbi:MAG: hypothetical protein IT432_15895 [Phycisphaerales bacterium]|nr:hypothetical protein [Phycisphaerales bacterium]